MARDEETSPTPAGPPIKLPPASRCGLGLVVLVLYGLLWTGWSREWPWVEKIDDGALGYFYALALSHGWWVPLWDGLSTVFAPGVWRLLIVLPVLWECWRHRYRVAAFLALSVWGSGLLSMSAKAVADRHRPFTQLVEADGSSFPSGHALGMLVAIGALLLAYSRLLGPRLLGSRLGARARWAVIGAGIIVVALVGIARVALNVHHPSDVLAGWLLGAVWLGACAWLFPPNQRGRKTESTR